MPDWNGFAGNGPYIAVITYTNLGLHDGYWWIADTERWVDFVNSKGEPDESIHRVEVEPLCWAPLPEMPPIDPDGWSVNLKGDLIPRIKWDK